MCLLQQTLHSSYGMVAKSLGSLDSSVYEMKKVDKDTARPDLNLNMFCSPDSGGIIHERGL